MTAPTETALARTSAVDPEVAAAMRIHDRLVPIKDALGISDFNDQEVSLFAMVAQRSGLDPFARQIYMIRRKGKATFQTGIDGYRSTAARTREYAGSDEATFEEPCPCGEKPDGHPSVARVVVKRIHSSGRILEQTGVARWHELKPDAGQDLQWQKMPFNQLAKCAEANGLRKLFPTVLADIYIDDEMAQAGPAENTKLAAAAGQSKPADRLAARRAAVESQATVEVLDEAGQPIVDDSSQDEAASAPEPTSEVADATSAASSAGSDPEGYRAFALRLNSTAATARPSRAQILKKALELHKDIPSLGLIEMPDWPFLPGAWRQLADALELAKVSA